MIHRYRITLQQHVKNTWSILIFAIIAVLFPVFMVYKFGPADLPTFHKYAIVGFMLFFAPQFIIHLKYHFLNRRRLLFYNTDNHSVIIEIDGIQHQFTVKEIDYILRYKSFSLAENRSQWLPWDSYNYSIIRLKNGKQFVVTSLLVLNMDLPVEANRVKLRKRFYCYPNDAKEVLDI